MRHRILLFTSFLYLAIANLIWIARDTRPPFWDMAKHQRTALGIYDAIAESGVSALGQLTQLADYYPPLYHSIVAVFYAVFGKTTDAAQWVNLPAIALLLIATYGLGRTLLDPVPAAAAAILVNFYPILLWLSRETMIEYWLTAMVALAMWLLIRTREFSDRRASLLFGIACGFGLLTKWTFPLFLALPALWLARKNFRNAMLSGGIAALMAGIWYVPSVPALAQFLRINSFGAVTEGDPRRFSVEAIIFYVRLLEGYQLFLPLFAAFIAGIILLARNFDKRWIPIILWIAGGWLGLLLFQNKDPRYSAPVLPAVALVTAQIFQRREKLVLALLPVVLFQHYLVSFGIRSLPETVVLKRGVQGPLSWDWNLYTQTYQGLWGRPAQEDWKISHVLTAVGGRGKTIRIGMVPDIPRFDTSAFEFYIALGKLPVSIKPLWMLDQNAILNNEYILVSEGDQGWSAARNQVAVNDYIFDHPESFRVVESFSLPNGSVIRLYRVGTS